MYWILRTAIAAMIIGSFALAGCSGCNKPEPTPAAPAVEKTKAGEPFKNFKFAKPKEGEKKAVKKDKLSESPTPATTDANPESRKKAMKLVPQIAESLKSPAFKGKIQQAAQSKDFKQVIQVLKDTMNDACEKQGMDFEECMKLMNEYKDDEEFKKMMKDLVDPSDFMPGQ
jgi:hypothetical protein